MIKFEPHVILQKKKKTIKLAPNISLILYYDY